ncbi:FAD-dependent oxidoreductase [Nocardia mangyaensis]|uniref:FAD-dependent oxidoreductase n=1 Tax=Nocardia mangyaensis TaxID=2213200 RepID=UPI00267570C2|nr:NAD(P)/FAD-dependent oxidoreductase [Nocardia mangyaensis]MDO3646213.1 NAD(P)/FAD-dependent oxidoreductase [Nocardia mangyaensis]
MRHSDVLVAGGGPVGLAAALLCAAQGLVVTVLEADAETAVRAGSRAIFVHGASVGALAKADPDLAQRLSNRGLTWGGKHTLWAGRTVYRTSYPHPRCGTTPPFTCLSQRDLEAELRRACLEAGVRLAWRTPVESVTVGPGHVEVGSGHRASFLIGADGARSTVRTAIGTRLAGTRSDASFIVVDLADDPAGPPGDRVFHYRHPAAGYRHVLTAPFRGGLRVDLQCRPTDDIAGLTADPTAWIAPLVPRGTPMEVTWVSHYRFHQAVADTFVDAGRRVLLAGEAAHLFAPFGARGLNSGIADATAAAEAVADGLTGTVTRAEAVTRYDTVRRAAALRNRDASAQALHQLLGTDMSTRARQRAAAIAARFSTATGAWLDRIPYGPRDAGIPGSPY